MPNSSNKYCTTPDGTIEEQESSGCQRELFLDLKAEIAKQEEEFAKNKAAGKATAIKPSVWAKQNAGVSARAARDIELDEISRPTIEAARAALERKAKVYDKLRKGKSGGLSEKQYDSLLVDFEQKMMDEYESDSDDVDESLTVPQPPTRDEAGDDPIVEYEDEFGRMRTARKSEVPRHLLEPPKQETEAEFDPDVIYNPVNHFPVYEPSAERVAAIETEFSEENNPLNMHYNASGEVRAKGAGFYQFSGDEETRRQQMEELRRAREETERTRETTGAADVLPGEVEGMQAPGEGAGVTRSRAMEKRKRELEERRKMLDAKRRKVAGPAAAGPVEPVSAPTSTAPTEKAPASSVDPFAALEAQAARFQPGDRKGKTKEQQTESPFDAADAFLAQLEQDVLKGVRR
ncbi:hypothetical protein B0H21DRAFT_825537 [Amylocystis lapponica]|nr:hypothetical protein B0H21DRAFT_825537 [Amylocystis lapponica]